MPLPEIIKLDEELKEVASRYMDACGFRNIKLIINATKGIKKVKIDVSETKTV